MASRKYGLDEAILGNNQSEKDPEGDKKAVESLLKKGAHVLLNDDGTVDEGQSFCDANIDQILESNTETRAVGGKAGNTFSVANFAAEAEDFAWEDFYGDDAIEAMEASKATAHMVDGPRKRKRVNYKVRLGALCPEWPL